MDTLYNLKCEHNISTKTAYYGAVQHTIILHCSQSDKVYAWVTCNTNNALAFEVGKLYDIQAVVNNNKLSRVKIIKGGTKNGAKKPDLYKNKDKR